MIRSLTILAVYYAVRTVWPLRILYLLFSEEQHAHIETFLTWALPIIFLFDLNAMLSRWAENKWMWNHDKSAWHWRNELAVVTGGSSGIGFSVVEKLVSYGITVAVLDVEPFLNQLQPDQMSLVSFYQCDITSRDAVHKTAEKIRSDHGSPSVLINNAGIGNANTILEITPERLRSIFDVNLLSHWNTVQEFLPDMIAKKKGHIMSTASLAAFLGLAGMVDYSCTKAGMIAFYEGLTQELKHRYNAPQIKTSIVFPNWTKTRLTSHLTDSLKRSKAPILDPEDVAEAMVQQIIAAKSGQVILGPSLAASIRAFPWWVQEFIRDRLAQIVITNATTAVS
ncbi:NAD(P)-binding protein [Pleomassaria siparia CBS 279.74]|uniref:Short-chain dehydrogenase/reductase 3 n=1 Tax=Pleomassaria siparia CBS 279.74 TaxID=1314801 RepID=A0A6G1K0V9_9PLEO|nr:NAD(P)-binding protein [Pleomassaria siparia CBS 279.74]